MTLTEIQYDEIAYSLHASLVEYNPFNQDEDNTSDVAGWNAVRGAAARLCTVFDTDTGFDHHRFLAIVMTGRP